MACVPSLRDMPLEGHWNRQQTGLQALPARQLRALLVGALLTVALLVTVVIAAVSNSAPAPHPGCERVTVATSTGGASVERCR
jgi:hypothetical protein